MKFSSSRIDKTDYNFKLSYKQAQKNDEIVALGDNQLFRTIRQVMKREVDHRNKFSLFMPEVITIEIDKPNHYKKLVTSGVIVNSFRFKRFLCGAGHARNNTVYFLREDIFDQVQSILENGHRSPLIMNPAKYNAYFGLYASASKVVTTPRVCVIKDFKFNREELVDWIEGDVVSPVIKNLEFNAFDGQGLISPQMSEVWANDLDIDYLPSEFIIRAPFVKGMVCVFDFHGFAQENGINKVVDLWGKEHNIGEIDLLLSESQFKLWSAYDSWKQYEQNTNKNNLFWSVTKASPKKDKDTAFTNYQYLQTLRLEDEDIEALAKPTIDWLRGVATDEDPLQAILFLLGDKYHDFYEILGIPDNDVGKAVVLNNELLKHPHIKSKIHNLIEKKMRDACMGKLAVEGNYSMMVSDPYAQAQWAFGLDVTGLLNRDEHFSNYWNQKGVTKVDSCRSPMTHYSEHNILNLKYDSKVNYYYAYLQSGIVLNIWGNDCMRFADADFDGDIVMTTNNPYFIKGVKDGMLPITYEKSTAPKQVISYDSVTKADLSSFDTKIGVITNYSTSLYSLEAKHSGEKLRQIQMRLKILRREQGNQIDKAKGVEITGFPKHWISWSKINPSDSMEVKLSKDFNNDIIIEKKPYFMIYVYPTLKKELSKWTNDMETYCKKVWGLTLDGIFSLEEKSEEQEKFIKTYNKFIPVDMTPCVMNKLSKLMESTRIDLTKWKNQKDNVDWILADPTKEIVPWKMERVLKAYRDYQNNKRTYNKHRYDYFFDGADPVEVMGEFKEEVMDEILEVCRVDEYVNYCLGVSNKSFVWEVGGEALLKNVYNNRQQKVWIPIEDPNGESVYLNKRYTKMEVEL